MAQFSDDTSVDGAGALIILPTYDERENLPGISAAALAALPGAHLLVVDDSSPDGTGQLADELAREQPRLHVLHRNQDRGLGRAYLAGFRWALAHDYRYVFEMDADWSHDPADLPRLLAATGEADLVLGSRYIAGGGVNGWARHRQWLSKGGNLYARGVLGLPQRDLTGGFKCFRRGVLERLDLESVRSVGYAFQVELTWRAIQAGFRVREVPIVFSERREGASKMNSAIVSEAMLGLVRLRLRG